MLVDTQKVEESIHAQRAEIKNKLGTYTGKVHHPKFDEFVTDFILLTSNFYAFQTTQDSFGCRAEVKETLASISSHTGTLLSIFPSISRTYKGLEGNEHLYTGNIGTWWHIGNAFGEKMHKNTSYTIQTKEFELWLETMRTMLSQLDSITIELQNELNENPDSFSKKETAVDDYRLQFIWRLKKIFDDIDLKASISDDGALANCYKLALELCGMKKHAWPKDVLKKAVKSNSPGFIRGKTP